MSLPVLALLAGDQLVDVLHVRVNLNLLCGQGAEQQLEALLRLKGGGQGHQRSLVNLKKQSTLLGLSILAVSQNSGIYKVFQIKYEFTIHFFSS